MTIRKPLLTPDRIVRHVSDLTPALLAEQHGIRAVICDLDNTLAAWHSEEITGEVLDGAQSLAWVQAANRLPIGKAILEAVL